MSKTVGARVDFNEAMRALRDAAEELIPDGRIFFLGNGDHGPIVGSILSGVGIAQSEHGIQLVRVHPNGDRAPLGWFSP